MDPLQLIFLLVTGLTSVYAIPRFLVTAPNVLREGQNTTIYVATSGVPANAAVKVKLGNGPEETVSVANSIANTTVQVTRAMLGELDSYGRYYVELRASYGSLLSTQRILVNLASSTVLIQTDKPIYRPNEYVHCRVYTISDDTNAINMSIRFDVLNPDGLVLDRRLLSSTVQKNGIHQIHYQLPKFVKDGEWTLMVSYGKDYAENTTSVIEVKNYILPHFQVMITLDDHYISNETTKITGRVIARYSFNSGLDEGSLRLVFRLADDDNAVMIPSATISRSIINGRATFELDLARHVYQDGRTFESLLNHRLQIEASVRERSSGIREDATNRDCAFVTQPYKITFEATPWNFAPRIPFRFEAKIQHVSGRPGVNIPVTVSAQSDKGPITNGDGKTSTSLKTDEAGRVVHSFNIPSNINTMTIKVEAAKPGEPVSRRLFAVNRMTADAFIHISTEEGRLHAVDQMSHFKITLTHKTRVIYVTVTTGGIIVKQIQRDINNAAVSNIEIWITKEMSPSFRLIVWYIGSNNKLVAASQKYDVEDTCKNEDGTKGEKKRTAKLNEPTSLNPFLQTDTEVSVRNKDNRFTKFLPDTDTTLSISALVNSTVALAGIDKAVYFLRNENVLDRTKFFDTLEENDLGCGTGSGANPTELFTLAGVALLGNMRTPTRPRTTMTCKTRDPKTVSKQRKKRQVEESAGSSNCCTVGGQYGNQSNVENMVKMADRLSYCTSASALEAMRQLNNQGRLCTNSFFKCCYGNVTQKYKDAVSNGGARSSGEAIDEELLELLKDVDELTPRMNFIETWFFNTLDMPASGSLDHQVSIPSSITSWIISAVSMSDTGGMCVADPYSLTVEKPLFIKLHLPRTAAIGEHLQLKATIYNTALLDTTAYIYYYGTTGLCTEARPGEKKALRKRVKIRGGQSLGVTWLAIPTLLGKVKVNMLVISLNTNDRLEREITIVPSGSLVQGKVLIVNQAPNEDPGKSTETNDDGLDAEINIVQANNMQIQRTAITLGLPGDAIENGYYMELVMTGNSMTEVVEARSHQQLGINAIHPYYCGEQTMSRLGRVVYIGRYMRDSGLNLMTSQMEVQIKKNINQGIDNMVRYRVTGGAFSVYTGRPPYLWLTAFTLKTLSHTKDFSDKMVNMPNVLTDAKNYIINKQQSSGAWLKAGRQTSIMGGSARDDYFVSAYMLLSLLESGTPATNNNVKNGISYLLENVGSSSSTFKLAQTAYVLALADHSSASEVIGWLNDKAQTTGGTVKPQKFWPYDPASQWLKTQLEIETNGYGLLALVEMNLIEESNPHVEWLIRQQMSGNFYYSTQAQVVIMQALTAYSIKAPKGDLNLQCNLLAGDRKPFVINEENLAITKTFDVTKQFGETIHLDCFGVGTALATVNTYYYAKKSAAEKCGFNITVNASPKSTTNNPREDRKDMVIKVCTKIKPVHITTGMAIIDVGLGTSYSANPLSIKKLKDDGVVSMYEEFDRSVAFYLDKIDTNEVCLTFEASTELDIENIRPVPVKVYDYYEPGEKKCTTFYNPHGDGNVRINVDCEDNGKTCECLENNCAMSYGYYEGNELPKRGEDLNHLACAEKAARRPDYIFKATVVDEPRTDEAGVRYTNVRIEEVFNQGQEVKDRLTGTVKPFYTSASCPVDSPLLEVDKVYMIMGKDGGLGGGSKYFFNHHSYVVEMLARDGIRKLRGVQKRRARDQKNFLSDLRNTGCVEGP